MGWNYKAEAVEEEYETYIKYIVVQNTGAGAFADLEFEVNKFIESADDFLPSGPLQIGEHYIVQTLVNEEYL